MARNGGWPLANSQEGAEALCPKAREQQNPTDDDVNLEVVLLQGSLETATTAGAMSEHGAVEGGSRASSKPHPEPRLTETAT